MIDTDFFATMPGTMQDCIVKGVMFNKGKFPLGHVFRSDTDEIQIRNTQIGGVAIPDFKMEVPWNASHLTFDGLHGYFINRNLEVISEFDLTPTC
jgi:hypothetical protein